MDERGAAVADGVINRMRPPAGGSRARRWAAVFAAVVVAGALAGPAGADVRTFTNADSDNAWSNALNWSPRAVPTSADDAVIPAGKTPILAGASGVAKSVLVATGASLQVTEQATLTVAGGGSSWLAGSLVVRGGASVILNGGTVWSSGAWRVGGAGASATATGGTVENRGALSISGNVTAFGDGVLRNLPGAAIASSGTVSFNLPFDNDGALTVGAGTLALRGGSGGEVSAGRFVIAGGAELSSSNGQRLSSGAQVTGPGTLRLETHVFEFAGGVDPSGGYSPGTTLASGGRLDLGGGSGSTGRLSSDHTGGGISHGTLVVGAGTSRLDSVAFDDHATVTFDPRATIEAIGGVFVRGGSFVALDGATTWSAGNWQVGGTSPGGGTTDGTVENLGSVSITANATVSGDGVVRNRRGGAITRQGSTGTATINVRLVNEGLVAVHSGTLATRLVSQLAGDIAVAGSAALGRSGAGATVTITGGTLQGTGTVMGSVANDGGTVRPGSGAPGILSITESYSQGAGGTLAVDIQGAVSGTEHDRLAVGGAATLGGMLAIRTGTGFDPPLDSIYDVVTARTRSGTFASLTGSALPAKRYRAEYEPAVARLRMVRADPIIFLHGFLGSRVICSGEEAWPGGPLRPDLPAMRLAPDGVSDLAGRCSVPEGGRGLIERVSDTDVYGSTVEFLNRTDPVNTHIFSWDWRKSPEQALAVLDALVDRVRQGGKVVLMAHSMGGLVTRWYIDDPGRAQKVARAVTIGTPYWGAPKALFPLAAGVEKPAPSELDTFLFNNDDLQALSRDLQGYFFLWPSIDYGDWLTVDHLQPGPLDRPSLFEFVRSLGGNTDQLRRAHAEHALHLDELRLNGVDYHVVVGTGLPTIGRVRITETSSGGDYAVGWVDGDGTVPRESARLGGNVPAGRLHHVCGIDHVALPGHPAVTGRIRAFLLDGTAIAGPEQDCRLGPVQDETFPPSLGSG
jgi:hypothetical protein